MANDLESKIIKQIEYYFGDVNLPRDKFMQEQTKKDDGWITIEVLLTFKRLASLSTDPEVIVSAIKKSETNLVVASEDGNKLRRNPDKPCPEYDDQRRKELSERTAYAKGFPLDENLDAILLFLEPYNLESCFRRTYLDKASGEHNFKGSCFITFKNRDDCEKFVSAESIKYKETELIRKWKNKYLEDKKAEQEEHKKERKKKKQAGKPEPEPEKKIKFAKGASIHFTGLEEGQIISREEIKDKIVEVASIEPSFIDFKKGGLEGYIRFSEENAAVNFQKKLTDGELQVGDYKLKIKVLEGDEEEKYLDMTTEILMKLRQSNKNRKRKGNFNNRNHNKKAKTN